MINNRIDGIKVLVADDDRSSILLLQEYFRGIVMNFDIIYVENGSQALDHVNNNTFDLVILDIQLPHVSGLEIMDHIKTRSPEVIVFAYTAHILPVELNRYLIAGFDEILAKPLIFGTFSQSMKKHFDF